MRIVIVLVAPLFEHEFENEHDDELEFNNGYYQGRKYDLSHTRL
jgi:hypothetical protein